MTPPEIPSSTQLLQGHKSCVLFCITPSLEGYQTKTCNEKESCSDSNFAIYAIFYAFVTSVLLHNIGVSD